MGIMMRMTRLWKADLHGVMDQLEDKKLLLKQYLREMKSCLEREKQRQDELIRAISNIEQDRTVCKTDIIALEKDLELAVRKEKDEIARMLIRKQRALKTALANLDRQHQVLSDQSTRLSETIENRRRRYDQLKMRAAAYTETTGRQPFDCTAEGIESTLGLDAVSDEEVELELLQRKETVSKEVAR